MSESAGVARQFIADPVVLHRLAAVDAAKRALRRIVQPGLQNARIGAGRLRAKKFGDPAVPAPRALRDRRSVGHTAHQVGCVPRRTRRGGEQPRASTWVPELFSELGYNGPHPVMVAHILLYTVGPSSIP